MSDADHRAGEGPGTVRQGGGSTGRPAPSLARALPPVYAAALLRLAFPVVVLPVMAARLGADDFGRLSLLLVWAGLLAMGVEGGFLAAATREAVRADAGGRWRLAQQVFSARCVLSAGAVAGAVAVVLWTGAEPGVWRQAVAAVLLAALACALGWPATWYLQASGQLHRWARVEFVVYALWLAATLAFAHSVQAYLALNLVAAGALAAAGWLWLRHDLVAAPQVGGASLWSPAALRPGLRLGWTMLPVSLAGAAYSFALPAVASAQMARSELGLYYLADRLVRSLLAAADPVFQLVYPRIVARFAQGSRAAWAYAGRWALMGAASGALLWLAGAFAWPWAQGLLAARAGGIDAARLHPVLALLGALLPLLLGWKFLGYAMLASNRYDRAYRACVVVGGVVGVVAAATFAARGALTLAGVAVAVETVVMVTALLGMALTRRARRSPG